MALASRRSDLDVNDSSCSTAGSEAAGQYAYRGRRSEPRNYRSHHRGLGHYHFGDSDPADDLARLPRLFGLAVRSGVIPHTGMAGLTLGGGMGSAESCVSTDCRLTSSSHSISSRPRVSSLRRARIGKLILLGSAWWPTDSRSAYETTGQ